MKASISRIGALLTATMFCAALTFANGPSDAKKDTKSDTETAAAPGTTASTPTSSTASAPSNNAPGNATAPADASSSSSTSAQDQSSSSSSGANSTSSTTAKPAKMGGGTADAVPTWTPIPAWSGGLGLFTAESGETLPKGGMSFSAGVNKFGRAPGSVTELDTGFNVGVGITDWLTATVQFDPDRHVHVGLPGQLSLNTPTTGAYQQYGNSPFRSVLPILGARPGYVEDIPFASMNGGGVGDVNVGIKFGVLSEDRGAPITLDIDNEFFIPTHTGLSDLLNDETQSGQLDYQLGFNASKRFFNNNFQFVSGMGYRFTPDAVFNGTTATTGAPDTVRLVRADQVHLDAGYVIFPNKRIQFMNEYNGTVYVGSSTPDMTFGPRDPVDGIWGVRAYLTHWLGLDVGYRYMLNLHQLNDRSGFVITLSSVYWPEKPKAPNAVMASCSVDSSSVTADSGTAVTATAQASNTYSYPMNYSWTATGGKIDGSGPQARWDSTGVAPGTYTLTANVDDGHGVTNSCSSTVTVNAKSIPAPTMSCSVDRSPVAAGERPTITATVNDQSNTTLNYQWQTNGGQIVGSGSSVQLDTTGLAPGTYTVTGRVQNGQGGAADCSANVDIQQPAAPQASKVGSCAFKAGSAKVDNVCKRVLDDVAVRLQNDPNATVVMIGYADPKEPKPDTLSKQRGDNADQYLFKNKGIAESRESSRTAPGQAGAGKDNYRVDIFFVPSGATF